MKHTITQAIYIPYKSATMSEQARSIPIPKRKCKPALSNNTLDPILLVSEKDKYPPIQNDRASKGNTCNLIKFCLFPLTTWPKNVPISLVIPLKWALLTRFVVMVLVTLFWRPMATADENINGLVRDTFRCQIWQLIPTLTSRCLLRDSKVKILLGRSSYFRFFAFASVLCFHFSLAAAHTDHQYCIASSVCGGSSWGCSSSS